MVALTNDDLDEMTTEIPLSPKQDTTETYDADVDALLEEITDKDDPSSSSPSSVKAEAETELALLHLKRSAALLGSTIKSSILDADARVGVSEGVGVIDSRIGASDAVKAADQRLGASDIMGKTAGLIGSWVGSAVGGIVEAVGTNNAETGVQGDFSEGEHIENNNRSTLGEVKRAARGVFEVAGKTVHEFDKEHHLTARTAGTIAAGADWMTKSLGGEHCVAPGTIETSEEITLEIDDSPKGGA